MKELEHLYESTKPVFQFLVTCTMGVIAHLDQCASVLALAVLIFQFKVTYYNSKIKKMEYDKEKRQS